MKKSLKVFAFACSFSLVLGLSSCSNGSDLDSRENSGSSSDESHSKLFDLIRSACDSVNVQITNVVEHAEDFSTLYYMRTSGTFSYIKVYINADGFITYAKPMSLKGAEDGELGAIIEILNSHFI